MKVRIVNDGKHGYNTVITSIETGQKLDYVTDLEIHIGVEEEPPKAVITMIYPTVDIIADADIKHICPYCGHPVDEKGKPL